MSTEPEPPELHTQSRAAGERSPELLVPSEAAQRADIEEDRRRQREMDDAELGGES